MAAGVALEDLWVEDMPVGVVSDGRGVASEVGVVSEGGGETSAEPLLQLFLILERSSEQLVFASGVAVSWEWCGIADPPESPKGDASQVQNTQDKIKSSSRTD